MIELNQIIKEVSEKTNIEIETVSEICKHVFLYTANTMKDDNDVSDILFNGLFKFKLKTRFKRNKQTKYTAI